MGEIKRAYTAQKWSFPLRISSVNVTKSESIKKYKIDKKICVTHIHKHIYTHTHKACIWKVGFSCFRNFCQIKLFPSLVRNYANICLVGALWWKNLGCKSANFVSLKNNCTRLWIFVAYNQGFDFSLPNPWYNGKLKYLFFK